MYNENERRPRNGAVLSVLCEEFVLTFDLEMGVQRELTFGWGVLRLYNDIRRIEYKVFGGDDDGVLYVYPFDLVRYYTYKPKVQRVEF